MHMGKPLNVYNLSAPRKQGDKQASSSVVDSVDTLSPTLCVSHSDASSIETTNSSTTKPMLCNSVLSFIKAFRQKSDKEALRCSISDRFNGTAIDEAKRALWSFCKCELDAKGVLFIARRDSDNRSQLMANIDDIIQAFDALDSSGSVPLIFCEANDLLHLPPLSLDPTAEQVKLNTQALQSLTSQIANLEDKLASLTKQSDTSPAQSYAKAVALTSAESSHQISVGPSRVTPKIKNDSRDRNLILFGLPECKSILQLKSEVDAVLEFLAERQIPVNDMFRLGKFSDLPSKRPRPVLIKLTSIWDRRVVLLRRRFLKEFHISRLFIREDVPPDHKIRQSVSTNNVIQPDGPSHSAPSFPNGESTDNVLPQTVERFSSLPTLTLSARTRSASPTLSQSSTSTVIQGLTSPHGSI